MRSKTARCQHHGGKEADLLNTPAKSWRTPGEGMKKFRHLPLRHPSERQRDKDQWSERCLQAIIEHSGPRGVHWHLLRPANEKYNFLPHVTRRSHGYRSEDRRQGCLG